MLQNVTKLNNNNIIIKINFIKLKMKTLYQTYQNDVVLYIIIIIIIIIIYKGRQLVVINRLCLPLKLLIVLPAISSFFQPPTKAVMQLAVNNRPLVHP
jgi:hypothetical protein